jgi:thiamine biosynthesis lipoprotein ApbE
VSAINRAAGGAPVAIDAETAALMRYADACHAASRGRFDITSGVLRRAWDFKRAPPRVPDAREVDALRALVDWPSVAWDERTIRLPRAGMEIDLGGIGKEYAADRVATIAIDAGIAHGYVNLGGRRARRGAAVPTARRGASASGIRASTTRRSAASRSPTARSRRAATTSGSSSSTACATATSSTRRPVAGRRSGSR